MSRYRAESRGEFALNGCKANHSTGTKVTIRRKTFLSRYTFLCEFGLGNFENSDSEISNFDSHFSGIKLDLADNLFRFLPEIPEFSLFMRYEIKNESDEPLWIIFLWIDDQRSILKIWFMIYGNQLVLGVCIGFLYVQSWTSISSICPPILQICTKGIFIYRFLSARSKKTLIYAFRF